MVGQIIVKSGNSAEIAAAGRELKAVAPLLRRIEKAYKTPTLFRFYRAMDAYEKLEKSEAGKAALPQAKESIREAFESRLPILERKASKMVDNIWGGKLVLVVGFLATGTITTFSCPPVSVLSYIASMMTFVGVPKWVSLRNNFSEPISAFKEKILGIAEGDKTDKAKEQA